MYGTNMHHGFTLARKLLARESGTKQIIMITDGEPTAHITANGMPFFNYPPVRETVEATLREVVRCTREQIRINTFVLGADGSLRHFIEQMTADQRWPGVLHDARDTSATTCWSTSCTGKRAARPAAAAAPADLAA